MQWVLSCSTDYLTYRFVNNKAVRLGVSTAASIRQAVADYMKLHPEEHEQEERKLYFPDKASES